MGRVRRQKGHFSPSKNKNGTSKKKFNQKGKIARDGAIFF